MQGLSGLTQIKDLAGMILRDAEGKSKYTFLDVGCGKGVYGFILRCWRGEYIKLFGIDIDLKGRSLDIVTKVYDKIIIGDLREELKKLEGQKFNCILAQHVLEHLEKEEAFAWLEKLKELSDFVIVGLPKPRKEHVYNGAGGRDPHSHKWGVETTELEKLGYFYQDKIKNNNLFVYRNAGKIEEDLPEQPTTVKAEEDTFNL